MQYKVIYTNANNAISNNKLVIIELLSGVRPLNMEDAPVIKKQRPVDMTLNAIMAFFNEEDRYIYAGTATRIQTNKTVESTVVVNKETYKPRYPFWVYDKKEKTNRCFEIAPIGKHSVHRYVGTAYGYPQCCITAFINRKKHRKEMTANESVNFGIQFDKMLNYYGYLEFYKQTGFEPCQCCVKTKSQVSMAREINRHAIVTKSMFDTNDSWLLLMYMFISNSFKFWGETPKLMTTKETTEV